MRRSIVDLSNRVHNGFTAEEFELRQSTSADYWQFSGRAVFTEAGYRMAREVCGAGEIIAHVNLLHTPHPDADPGFEFELAQRDLLSPAIAFTEGGVEAVRWAYDWTDGRQRWMYHVDASKADPADYAALVASFVDRFPVDGLFIDYFAEAPWTWPGEPEVTLADVGGLLWPNYQIAFAYQLRRLLGPDFILLGNGRWAAEQPMLVHPKLLSGVYWERNGTLWHDPLEAVRLMLRHDLDAMHFFDDLQGPKAGAWSMGQMAETLAAAFDQVAAEHWEGR